MPWGHGKLTRFRNFYCKKTKMGGFLEFFFVSRTRKFEYINEYGLPSHTRLCTQISKYRMATRTRLFTHISEYGFWWKSPKFLNCQKNFKIFNIHLQDCCWSICHILWVIWFESRLRNIALGRRYVRSRSWLNIGDSYSILIPYSRDH